MTYASFKSVCGQTLPSGSPTRQRTRNKWDGLEAKCTECGEVFRVRKNRYDFVEPTMQCPLCGKLVKVSLCLGYPE